MEFRLLPYYFGRALRELQKQLRRTQWRRFSATTKSVLFNLCKLALAPFACAAGSLVNSKNNSVARNGGSFQRRLELEDRRSALKQSLQCHPQTPRAPVHAYAFFRARQFKAARQLDERANCCK